MIFRWSRSDRRAGSDSLRSAWDFFLDLRDDARGEGVKAVFLVTLGAALEGVGLALLVPMLGAMTETGAPPLWGISSLPTALGIEDRLGKLMVLLASFAVLVLLRALILWRRDILLAQLRAGFVERQRTRLVERLVSAPWTSLSRMNCCKRFTTSPSGDRPAPMLHPFASFS